MKKPKVSILMTVYNHQDYVRRAILSILSQSYKNFELIVINNGSTDNTQKILRKIKDKRIKFFLLKKNIGRTKCLNLGLKKCRGKYIAIQDSDDISKKSRIKILLDQLEKEENLGLVASNYNIINENNVITSKIKIEEDLYEYPKKLIFHNSIAHSTVMFKKKVIDLIGNYPINFNYAQDYAFYLKIITKFRIKIIKKNLANLRINHKNSETYRLRKSISTQVEELKLIYWVLNNIKTNFIEKFKIIYKVQIIFIKIIRSFFI
tara:strand:+ start:102 stop:890 length:789 start_codon:yes stop_codon:yes gene_type:complete